ncbi:MAG: hypothetical protein A2487_21215 [Candidatus Raymondbacteria bacterium RifOxyC12_full_50_8]|uniref:Fibronectin type-III domain-containing protein n=1 Tax=Candidatus Raymondbacteria bacterium RIFOXYD12_FULL_49_13 TaxID=1817890 RepID=A0A1F7FEL1_UNCRA|nr:MAG: hypothetical protein A2248_05410 [Candidatus Raymondbacteria bacterium RIFOXYA2_FULL_49_16]OGK01682.1 MAG: hypothetical protein A2487_21215 [Candidatus Raymondbacteria bacterium RifOxyC12_full_50_8]OGK04937.1 MAG: hypothetical protein A2519_08185 [Candidatus Raymondbacteria bacterium RIFOXYD12_FULL_49_13]OGP41238.1 MAG: hypothetical protein A2324_15810 [Candidatus Raymondbacteria bacterium RIFOXYB2_FULL_49_35]
MHKMLFAALMTLVIGIPAVLNAATGADVVPINWAQYTKPEPADTLSVKMKDLHLTALKYCLNEMLDTLPTDSSGYYDFRGTDEFSIRPWSEICGGLGIALGLGTYDSAVTGISEAEARVLHAKLVKSLAYKHKDNMGWISSAWGNCWQCRLWATYMGVGAFLVWEELDSLTQTYVARVVHGESRRLSEEPPYCNDCTNDTKAEENAWDANIISLAVAMMPNDSAVQTYKKKASRWFVSAFARESDLNRATLVDGTPVKDWISGWNIREEGYLYNHNRIHPDYMCVGATVLRVGVIMILANQIVPQSAVWNTDLIYECLVNYRWPSPPYYSPGGTIYQDDSARVYYPQGTDWSANRVNNFLSVDNMMDVFELDDNVRLPADYWINIRVDHCLWMQSRTVSGRLFIEEEHHFHAENSSPAFVFGIDYLGRWLVNQEAEFLVGNWHLSEPDTNPPSAPAALTADTLGPNSVSLSWSASKDTGSGVAYYLVYRDSIQIIMTQDTFYLDNSLVENTEYHYRVAAIDWNNNKSPNSTGAIVSTPNDTRSLTIERVTAVNGSRVVVAFNKPVDSVSAENTANYSISGLSVSSAVLNLLQNMVILDVSAMTFDNVYTLTVSNIQDFTNPPHTIPSNTETEFTFSDLNNNLVGYWPMDEEQGSMIYDYSGNNNNGTFINSCSRIPGVLDNAVYLNPGEHIEMDNSLQNLTFPYSISLWVKIEETDSSRSLLVTEDMGGRYYGTWMAITQSGQVTVNFGNGGTPSTGSRKSKVSADTVSRNIWTYVAAVVNNATDMTLYIDGVDAGGTYSGTATSMAHSVAGRMQIGYQTSAITPILYYHGGMDDIRVYDTALTQEQIGHLAADTLTTDIAGKIAARRVFSLDAMPNPFNPSAVITFSIPAAQRVVLDVFDVKGSRVARLVDGKKEAGEYRLVWAGSQQASGVYLLRMQAGTKTMERKLVYLK